MPTVFYDCAGGVGAHELIIEDPGHTRLEDHTLPVISQVINAWKIRTLDLMRDIRLSAFFIIRNVGAPAGMPYDHSVSQLVAMAVIPPVLKTETRRRTGVLRAKETFHI